MTIIDALGSLIALPFAIAIVSAPWLILYPVFLLIAFIVYEIRSKKSITKNIYLDALYANLILALAIGLFDVIGGQIRHLTKKPVKLNHK